MPDSRQNTNGTDSYAFVGGKKGRNVNVLCKAPCLWCTHANCPDPERWCVCVWTRPVVVVVFLVVVLSTTSSYRAFVTVSFRSFALLCLFERICRRCRNSSCWPLCVMTTELTASYYTFTVSVCKRKIMFDHVHFIFFLPLTNTSLQSACNKSRREKKKRRCVLPSIQFFFFFCLNMLISLDLNSYVCAMVFLSVQSHVWLLWMNEAVLFFSKSLIF